MALSVDITNTGERSGSEVVQVYVRDKVATQVRPLQELKAFQRVTLSPGETTTLTFTVKPDGASDKAISVHSTDPQTATVTLNGLVATVKGVKQGSVSIVGMTSDGDFVAVAAVAVSAAG